MRARRHVTGHRGCLRRGPSRQPCGAARPPPITARRRPPPRPHPPHTAAASPPARRQGARAARRGAAHLHGTAHVQGAPRRGSGRARPSPPQCPPPLPAPAAVLPLPSPPPTPPRPPQPGCPHLCIISVVVLPVSAARPVQQAQVHVLPAEQHVGAHRGARAGEPVLAAPPHAALLHRRRPLLPRLALQGARARAALGARHARARAASAAGAPGPQSPQRTTHARACNRARPTLQPAPCRAPAPPPTSRLRPRARAAAAARPS